MSPKMQLVAKLDQRLAMNQQLRQAITLLQYNTIELKQLVQNYLENNPLIDLEEAENTDNQHETDAFSTEKNQSNDYTAALSKSNQFHEYNDENSFENYSVPQSLREYLLEQTLLCKFDPVEQLVAEAIIDAIDDHGYLTMTLEEIKASIDTLGVIDFELMQTVLQKVKTFDPPGIAAYDMQECLLLQLASLPQKNPIWLIANRIIRDCFDVIASNNTKKIIRRLNISEDEYAQAMLLIRSLDPHPGLQHSNEMDIISEPELYVKKIRDTWHVYLAGSILTGVKINQQYQDLLKKSKKEAAYEALTQELQEAQWLLKGLKKRNETLLRVGAYIVELQKEFFDRGHAFMKPMNIIDVSYALELHESTVSRITTGKYISTPHGIFELKYFFPSHVTTQNGDTCSDTAVKVLIKEIISQETENHVLSDGEITVILQEKGINIARRTVAKYREAMKILSSYQRLQTRSRSNKIEILEPV
jgi:RNA polymerase sigma-54 factor